MYLKNKYHTFGHENACMKSSAEAIDVHYYYLLKPLTIKSLLSQCCYRDVNNNMMELQILAYACRTSSARNIVGVVPYLPYSKQSKMRKRGSIVCKLLAQMLSKSGILFS